ncbi:MAG: hypothetical protein JWL59_557 [Chthoniobacteraceae bacterium]|nr:hypothetical protein [Chthoniobacteraceae bacterium]
MDSESREKPLATSLAMSRRILIVGSALPPTILADMHRVRMLANDLPAEGWEVELLTPCLGYQHNEWIEPEAEILRPKSVVIHEVPLCGDRLFRKLSMRSVGWRVLWPMFRLGLKVLKSKRFDLVYISTTQFNLFCLGRLWLALCGVPYVLDYHDPWFRRQTHYVTTQIGIKSWLTSALAKPLEYFAVGKASGIVSVSEGYLEQLRDSYGDLDCLSAEHAVVIPFGAAENDLIAAGRSKKISELESRKLLLEVIYVGAGGTIMAKSFDAVTQALGALRLHTPELASRVRIKLFGTQGQWQPGDPKVLEDIARKNGVEDLVEEHPSRIGYLKALELILMADGLLVLGVDDPAYMPSKLFTYALTGKPLLVSFHSRSQSNAYFKAMPNLGKLIQFEAQIDADIPNQEIMSEFVAEMVEGVVTDRKELIAAHLSTAMARQHSALFNRCVSNAGLVI